MRRYRIYIDESGDHVMKRFDASAHRYLGLTGVVIQNDTYRTEVHPSFEAFKQRHFPHNPDDPVILHRDDLLNRRGAFGVLADPEKHTAFNTQLLQFFEEHEYTIITVVIDKESHAQRYGSSAYHPYHYCLVAIMERYAGFLHLKGGHGDVVAESREGREDMQLKTAYAGVYESGTAWRSTQFFQSVLTSKEIKIKRKDANITGLQMADLLAHPCKQEVLLEAGRIEQDRHVFGKEMCRTIAIKYNRWEARNKINGYGKIFLA